VARLGNRTLDTLHVASALELKAERFWTFDDRQAKLARAAGLRTD
jgi:predicted nucleic acid-binding protein